LARPATKGQTCDIPAPTAREDDMSIQTSDRDQVAEPTIRELIGSATRDVTTIVSCQVELAKAELRDSARQAGSAFGLLAVAGLFGLLAFVFLLVTLAYVLVQVGLPTWAGFGIVTLLLILVAAILAGVGKKHAVKIKGPERTVAQLEQTGQALSAIGSNPR